MFESVSRQLDYYCSDKKLNTDNLGAIVFMTVNCMTAVKLRQQGFFQILVNNFVDIFFTFCGIVTKVRYFDFK